MSKIRPAFSPSSPSSTPSTPRRSHPGYYGPPPQGSYPHSPYGYGGPHGYGGTQGYGGPHGPDHAHGHHYDPRSFLNTAQGQYAQQHGEVPRSYGSGYSSGHSLGGAARVALGAVLGMGVVNSLSQLLFGPSFFSPMGFSPMSVSPMGMGGINPCVTAYNNFSNMAYLFGGGCCCY